MSLIWFAPEAKAKTGATLGTVAATSTLWTQVTASSSPEPGDFTDTVKELRIRGGTADVSALNLLGANQKLDESRPELMEAEFTRVFNQAVEWNDLKWNNQVATSGDASSYTRTQGIDRTGSRPKRAFAFQVSDGTNESNFLMNNAVVTNVERSLNSEGHMEETTVVKCLVADFLEEFK